ncbi:hypothetical protein K456DRAFT_40125 [Colletotrichum gloeosporioides 23]|nr:hypothetical protein K456DRAFT_40125 [Colletotrichum gloeosporioides 23]
MAAAATYEPSVATVTIGGPYGESGYDLAATITLMPQTIAFTPTASGCGIIPPGIRCYDPDFTTGGPCIGDYSVESTGASLATECFPRGYNYIWMPLSDTYRENTTLVAEEGRERATRDCVSMLSTPTVIWVMTELSQESSWTKTYLSDFSRWAPIQVLHPSFPLDGRLPNIDNKDVNGGLSTGAIAGIVIAIVAVVLAFIVSAMFVVWSRKRKERRLAQTPNNNQGPAFDDKQLGFDAKAELPGQESEIRELQALSPRPAELSAPTKPSEMDASAAPVELPS